MAPCSILQLATLLRDHHRPGRDLGGPAAQAAPCIDAAASRPLHPPGTDGAYGGRRGTSCHRMDCKLIRPPSGSLRKLPREAIQISLEWWFITQVVEPIGGSVVEQKPGCGAGRAAVHFGYAFLIHLHSGRIVPWLSRPVQKVLGRNRERELRLGPLQTESREK